MRVLPRAQAIRVKAVGSKGASDRGRGKEGDDVGSSSPMTSVARLMGALDAPKLLSSARLFHAVALGLAERDKCARDGGSQGSSDGGLMTQRELLDLAEDCELVAKAGENEEAEKKAGASAQKETRGLGPAPLFRRAF